MVGHENYRVFICLFALVLPYAMSKCLVNPVSSLWLIWFPACVRVKCESIDKHVVVCCSTLAEVNTVDIDNPPHSSGKQSRRQTWFRVAMAVGDKVAHQKCLLNVLCDAHCGYSITDESREDDPTEMPCDPPYLKEMLKAWDEGGKHRQEVGGNKTCSTLCTNSYPGCSSLLLKGWKVLVMGTLKAGISSFDFNELLINWTNNFLDKLIPLP